MAELLILNRHGSDASHGYRRGDVVVVMPDGHVWGASEGLPDFIRASLPGVAPEAVRAALTLPHQIEAAAFAPSAIRALPGLLKRYSRAHDPDRIARRRYAVQQADLDAHIDGRIALNLGALKDKSHANHL